MHVYYAAVRAFEGSPTQHGGASDMSRQVSCLVSPCHQSNHDSQHLGLGHASVIGNCLSFKVALVSTFVRCLRLVPMCASAKSTRQSCRRASRLRGQNIMVTRQLHKPQLMSKEILLLLLSTFSADFIYTNACHNHFRTTGCCSGCPVQT